MNLWDKPEEKLKWFREDHFEVHRQEFCSLVSTHKSTEPWLKIRDGIDTSAFMEEIRKKEIILQTTVDPLEATRDTFSDTQKIYLRAPYCYAGTNRPHGENHVCADTSITRFYPKLMEFIQNFAANEIRGKLGIILITRLKEDGGVVKRHFDRGSYYAFYDRYHLVLESNGSVMVGNHDNEVTWKTGELWWFNNATYHSAKNVGHGWRYHVIFDILPETAFDLHKYYLPHIGYDQEELSKLND